MQLTVSQYIARFLKVQGIRAVYELSGGMIMHLMDAVQQEGGIELINVYHEQAAAFAADAAGRISGKPGVALATSGPGAINLLTGVGSSFFDSSPALFITGQVNRHEQKGTRAIRQLGFQETDIVAMARPVTKMAERITQASEVEAMLAKAYLTAMDGRPGAVLLDIPMDVFRATIEVDEPAVCSVVPACSLSGAVEAKAFIQRFLSELGKARRPVILAGGGIRAALAAAEFEKFASRYSLPVVHSLLACDLLPCDHALRAGMIGTYGNRWANLALSQADLVLVLGSRLDIRQTGADTRSFSEGKVIFHVDVEAHEINNRVTGCIPLPCDLKAFFAVAGEIDDAAGDCAVPAERREWLETIADLKAQWPDSEELAGASGINPNVFMREVSAGRSMGAVCVDVGLHQMWAAQSLMMKKPCRFLTSGGMGAMGFALPAGVGAAFELKGKWPVVVIAGDAGFQLNLQELQTVAHHRLPLKIVVMNNRCHGMTRQFQDTYFASRYTGTVWGYSPPDFAAIAEAYGIPSRRLPDPDDIADAVEWLWAEPLSPALLEVAIDLKTNAYPKMAFGKPMSEMEPFASPMEMEGT